MTKLWTFVKFTIATVTISATAIVFSARDPAAAENRHYSSYADQSTMSQGSGATATPNTPRSEGRGTRRQR